MSPEERNACKMLLKTNDVMSDDETQSDDDDIELDITTAIENQEKRKALEMEGQSKHVNCNFITDSATIVE